jgi:Protein of unknown function (DUF2971)
MDSLPRLLYKYVGPDRVDILINGLIRYTPLGAFNEPFEGRPSITAIAPESEIRETLRQLLPEQTKRAFEELDPKVRALISYEAFAELVAQVAKSKEPALLSLFSAFTPTVRSMLHQKLDQHIGILSLSEVADSLLMWSHYAMSHTGCAIGFNTEHSYFDERKGSNDELRHLRRVVYRDSRPHAPMTGLDGVDFFLVKSIQWAYEREWRILRPLNEASSIIDAQPFAIHLFKLPLDCLTELIIGARASEVTKAAIYQAIRANPLLGHLRVKQASADDDHFLLRFTDIAI